MLHNRKDLLILMMLTCIEILLVLAGRGNSWIGMVLGGGLILAFPGYGFVSLFLPFSRLEGMEKACLILATSISISVLGGLLLNCTPWGLGPASWVLFLGGMTLLFTILTILRNKARTDTDHGPGNFNVPFTAVLFLGIALLISIGAIRLSILGAANQPYPGFTQFWALQDTMGAPNEVHLGISSHESSVNAYILRLEVEGKTFFEREPLSLDPGESWEIIVELPETRTETMIDAFLYKQDAPGKVYRHIILRSNE